MAADAANPGQKASSGEPSPGAGSGGGMSPRGTDVDTAPPRASAGCNSFAGDTPVLMADGTSKPIEQVKVGDTVSNAEPDSATVQKHVVTAIHVTTTDREFDDLTVATPDGPKTVEVGGP